MLRNDTSYRKVQGRLKHFLNISQKVCGCQHPVFVLQYLIQHWYFWKSLHIGDDYEVIVMKTYLHFIFYCIKEAFHFCLHSSHRNGTSMISLIIPPKDQIARVSKMLADEFGTASNIKSRVNRLSVLSAITSVQQRLKLYTKGGRPASIFS